MTMKTTALAAALLLGVSGLAQAACSEADATAKTNTLGELMTRLLTRNPAEAQRISEAMTQIMMEPSVTDATCTRLDTLIAAARR